MGDPPTEWSNNLVYNWAFHCGYTSKNQRFHSNLRGNYHVAGPSTPAARPERREPRPSMAKCPQPAVKNPARLGNALLPMQRSPR
ncbi:hypothetical protein [Sorangium sp. So ce381]|uniref:hypothetical protein n=1 Tax=Sorangium sp. So ce381 TaxID=3133307 RepID=UPI003F5B07D2